MARRVAREKKKTSKVEQAQRKLEKAQEDLERWDHQASQYALDLADAERSLGEKVVEGVPEDVAVSRTSTQTVVKDAAIHLTALRAQHETAKAAAEVARGKIDKAQRGVWLAEAGELRAKAGRLRARAEKRQRKTDELLEQLLDHEGVDYVPTPEPQTGSSNPIMDAAGIIHYIPKTQGILNDAAQLEYQAQALQDRAANTPEARAELAEQRRKAREETLAHINAENEQKRLDDIRATEQQRRKKDSEFMRKLGAGHRE